ncbi:MAG: hypothetical protein AB7O88_05625 [Reyranellaceae bacterium]
MSHPQEDNESPVWGVVRLALMFLLFVPSWAGLNFAFGSALDGPVGVLLMEPPCQRLAQRLGGPPEPLNRYVLGQGTRGRRSTPSVCHFASRSIRVGDSPTEGLGFSEREFAYLVVGFVGYAACLAVAAVLAFFVVKAGWSFIGQKRKARKPSGI